MTDEQINIAIAEACGWRGVTLRQQEGLRGVIRGYPPNVECTGLNEQYIPDYCNDLNAMHEVELSNIVPMTTPCYYDTLQFIIFRDKGMTDESPELFTAWLAHATAHQRAEAFLKTLNSMARTCNCSPTRRGVS